MKNNTWTHREKEFRVYDYKPYSDPSKWNADEFVGTGYEFSPQTGPTGISVERGEAIMLFVGAQSLKGNTSLKAMVCPEMNVTGPTYNLKPGFNLVVADEKGHLFIDYRITSVSARLATIPSIPIHIEGGRVNGYFDITRGHTNKDFEDMSRTISKIPLCT